VVDLFDRAVRGPRCYHGSITLLCPDKPVRAAVAGGDPHFMARCAPGQSERPIRHLVPGMALSMLHLPMRADADDRPSPGPALLDTFLFFLGGKIRYAAVNRATKATLSGPPRNFVSLIYFRRQNHRSWPATLDPRSFVCLRRRHRLDERVRTAWRPAILFGSA